MFWILNWKDKHFDRIPKSEFQILFKVIANNVKTMTENIKSGFKATGLFPYNK